MISTKKLSFRTRGEGDMIDITPDISQNLAATSLSAGTVTVFVSGSTAGVTTIEYEPGLVADFADLWQKIAPKGPAYAHDKRWGDGNGYAHVRASLLGPSLVVPFQEGQLLLGTWQQIVVVDFDNRARNRTVLLQFMGE